MGCWTIGRPTRNNAWSWPLQGNLSLQNIQIHKYKIYKKHKYKLKLGCWPIGRPTRNNVWSWQGYCIGAYQAVTGKNIQIYKHKIKNTQRQTQIRLLAYWQSNMQCLIVVIVNYQAVTRKPNQVYKIYNNTNTKYVKSQMQIKISLLA